MRKSFNAGSGASNVVNTPKIAEVISVNPDDELDRINRELERSDRKLREEQINQSLANKSQSFLVASTDIEVVNNQPVSEAVVANVVSTDNLAVDENKVQIFLLVI